MARLGAHRTVVVGPRARPDRVLAMQRYGASDDTWVLRVGGSRRSRAKEAQIVRKALFILGDLSDSDIDWLAETGRKQQLATGAVLIQRGASVGDVYILLEGRLSVRLDAEGTREINALLPGEFIGELSFLDSRPPSATVLAVTPSVVAAVARDELEAKLRRDTAFAARFYRALGVFLAHRLRRLTLKGAGGIDAAANSFADQDEDELDPQLLESVSLAAKRFEWFQARFGVT